MKFKSLSLAAVLALCCPISGQSQTEHAGSSPPRGIGHRQAAIDCTLETGGKTNEQCHELDDDDLYVCETGPCNGAGWVLYSSVAGGGDQVSVDGVATTDPDLRSDGDLSIILCTGAGAPDASCPADQDVIARYKVDSLEFADIAYASDPFGADIPLGAGECFFAPIYGGAAAAGGIVCEGGTADAFEAQFRLNATLASDIAIQFPFAADTTVVGETTTQTLTNKTAVALKVDSAGATADPADTGAIRLDNADSMCWEQDPANATDMCITVGADERLSFNGPGYSGTAAYLGADPADVASGLNLSNNTNLCWESSPASATEVCISVDAAEEMTLGVNASKTIILNPLSVQGAATFTSSVLSSRVTPAFWLDDTDFTGTEGAIRVDVPTDNDATLQLTLESGTADDRRGFLTLFTDDAGSTTSYLGGNATPGSPPAAGAAFAVTEDGAAVLPYSATPTTDAAGEMAFDTNGWAASRGTIQLFDGTANTNLVGTVDTPLNGQVPVWKTGGFVEWEDQASGTGDITDVGNCGGPTCPGPIVFSGVGDETLQADGFIGPGADPADSGVLRLSNAETICWEQDPAHANDVCMRVDSGEILRVAENGTEIKLLAQTEISGSWLSILNANPRVYLNDLAFSDPGEFLMQANAPTDNDAWWQISSESGATSRVGMVTLDTTGAGVSTLFLGGAATEGSNPAAGASLEVLENTDGGQWTVRLPYAATPTTDQDGELIVDLDAWAAGRDAIEFFDGTESTYLIGALASDSPTDKQIPQWNTGGTVTWVDQPKSCIELYASDVVCPTTNGCTGETIDGTGHSYITANFATGADSSGSWTFAVPAGFTGATASVQIDWTSNNAACNAEATDDLCLTFDSGSVANDGAWNAPTLGGTANGLNDTCIANGDMMRETRTGYVHGLTDGQRGVFVLTRDVAGLPTGCASEDDYAQDAKILAITICPE